MRDRIKELRRVPANELRVNPRNWRRHPAAQATALTAVLEQVGYAGALAARETPEGLELLDGHLRREVADDTPVPVLILDVSEQEAALLLASYDPVGDLAEADYTSLELLLADIEVESEDIGAFLADLLPAEPGARETAFLDGLAEDAEGEQAWSAPAPGSPYFTIAVTVTAEERDVIRGALAEAKQHVEPQTTPAALVAICRAYLGETADANREVG